MNLTNLDEQLCYPPLNEEAAFWMAEVQDISENAERTIGVLLSLLEKYCTREEIEADFAKRWPGCVGHIANEDNPTPYPTHWRR